MPDDVSPPRTEERLQSELNVARYLVVTAACLYIAGDKPKGYLAKYVERYRQANIEYEAFAGGGIS